MTAPLPPVVNGSVYAVPNVQISADNVLPDALVAVFRNGKVGRPPRPSPGMLWVPTTVALTIGGKIAATQTYIRGRELRAGNTRRVQRALALAGHRVAGDQAAARAGLSLCGVPVQRRRLARQPHLRSY